MPLVLLTGPLFNVERRSILGGRGWDAFRVGFLWWVMPRVLRRLARVSGLLLEQLPLGLTLL